MHKKLMMVMCAMMLSSSVYALDMPEESSYILNSTENEICSLKGIKHPLQNGDLYAIELQPRIVKNPQEVLFEIMKDDLACGSGYDIQANLVRECLLWGAKVNEADELGNTALHYVKHKETAKMLLGWNSSVIVKNKNEMTPLHSAILNGHDEVIEAIKEDLRFQKTVINEQDNTGNTPLHLMLSPLLLKNPEAINNDTIQQLINCCSNHIDFNLKNNQGKTVFDLAKECHKYGESSLKKPEEILQKALEKQQSGRWDGLRCDWIAAITGNSSLQSQKLSRVNLKRQCRINA